ncbi:MAG: arylsulfatase, partial [Bacteroidetes bacterium]
SKPLFWEWSQGQAIREGDWKLVRWGTGNPWDLYNISDDPTETNNLAAAKTERVQAMEQQFLDWKKRVVSGSLN